LTFAGDDTPLPATFPSGTTCDAASALGSFRRAGDCAVLTGADAGKGGPQAALLDATRGGFRDVDRGQPVMPINIDLGMLAAAMHENRHGELGMHACLPGAAGGCPDGQRFNGVLSISKSREGAIVGARWCADLSRRRRSPAEAAAVGALRHVHVGRGVVRTG
jgi:hypothetical protein